MSTKRDYYEVLEIPREASADQIKQAYRQLARKHHPDVNSNDSDAESRFKEINEAYEVLKDPEKREVYDRYGHQGFEQFQQGSSGGYNSGFESYGFGDIFDMFFGSGGQSQGRPSRPGPEQGGDIRYDAELTLEEAASGVTRNVRLTKLEICDECQGSGSVPGSHPTTCNTCRGSGQVRQQQNTIFGSQIRITTCPSCHGEGQVITNPCVACHGQMRVKKSFHKDIQIPAGVDTGMKVRFVGDGDAGLRGGPPGDLYVVTHIKKHDFFTRKGNDLWCEVHISYPIAALGSKMDVSGIDEKLSLEISPGTQSGEVYKLNAKGMPDPRGGYRGNLNVVVTVDTPTKLSDEEKELLKKLADIRGDEIHEVHGKSLFERIKGVFNGL